MRKQQEIANSGSNEGILPVFTFDFTWKVPCFKKSSARNWVECVSKLGAPSILLEYKESCLGIWQFPKFETLSELINDLSWN